MYTGAAFFAVQYSRRDSFQILCIDAFHETKSRTTPKERTGMKSKRKIRLGRSITLFMLISYMAIITLLVVLDTMMLVERRNAFKEETSNALKEIVSAEEYRLSRISELMDRLYFYDENYRAFCESEHKDGENDQNLYALMRHMRENMNLSNYLHGFYIFYPNEERVRYITNADHIEPDVTHEIALILQSYAESMEKGNLPTENWITFSCNDKAYMACFRYQNRISAFGIRCLGNLSEQVKTGGDGQYDLAVLSGLSYLQGEGKGEEAQVLKHRKTSSIGVPLLYTEGADIVAGQQIADTSVEIFLIRSRKGYSLLTAWQVIVIIMEIVGLLGSLWILHIFYKDMIRPLQLLTEDMNQLRQKKKTSLEREFRAEELQNMEDTLSLLLKEREMEAKKAKNEAVEKQNVMLQYLQLQVKPHFYLNGLKTLSILIAEGKKEEAGELILGLSEYMRYILNEKRQKVTLEEEMTFCHNYIKLQNAMKERQFVLSFFGSEDTKRSLVPIMSVFTFVENSVKYAVRSNQDERELCVQVRASLFDMGNMTENEEAVMDQKDGFCLDLVMRDNGEGYSEEILEKINGEGLVGTDEGRQSSGHIGIMNVIRRMQMLYGDRAEYSFYNEQGAVMELIIPQKI